MRYLVRAGDCIESLAARFGTTVDALLGLGDNRRLREDGRSPNVLRPGEAIEVPEPPSCSASFSSGGTKRFRVEIPMTTLRIQLSDRSGAHVANRRFEVEVSGRTLGGQTDGEGWVEQRVPATATEALLRVWMRDGDEHPYETPLAIGGVDPLDDEAGLIHRLANLGFGIAAHGREGMEAALRHFQAAEGLSITARLDDATRARLIERHGS